MIHFLSLRRAGAVAAAVLVAAQLGAARPAAAADPAQYSGSVIATSPDGATVYTGGGYEVTAHGARSGSWHVPAVHIDPVVHFQESPQGLDVAPDGTVYFAGFQQKAEDSPLNTAVWSIAPDAPSGSAPVLRATDSTCFVSSLDVRSDGSLLVAGTTGSPSGYRNPGTSCLSDFAPGAATPSITRPLLAALPGADVAGGATVTPVGAELLVLRSGVCAREAVPLPAGSRAIAAVNGPDGVYVTTQTPNAMLVLDRTTFKVVRSVALPAAPTYLATDRSTGTAYVVTGTGGGSNNTVMAIPRGATARTGSLFMGSNVSISSLLVGPDHKIWASSERQIYQFDPDTANLTVPTVMVSPAAPLAGQPATLSATIRNSGLRAVPAGTPLAVSFSVAGTAVVTASTSSGLAVGASTVVTGSTKWTPTVGFQTVVATVDPANSIRETFESDNTGSRNVAVPTGSGAAPPAAAEQSAAVARLAVRTAGSGSAAAAAPDLAVVSVTTSPSRVTYNNPILHTVTVKNVGSAPLPASTPFTVIVRIQDHSGSGGGWREARNLTIKGGGLAVGASSTVSVTDRAVGYRVGEQLRVIAKSYAAGDVNPVNDTATTTFYEGPVKLPNLLVSGVRTTVASPAVGVPTTLLATITNTGPGATPIQQINGIVTKVDGNVLAWGDTCIGAIQPGASVDVPTNAGRYLAPGGVWTPKSAGSHPVTTTVDDADRIWESNESDNVTTGTLVTH